MAMNGRQTEDTFDEVIEKEEKSEEAVMFQFDNIEQCKADKAEQHCKDDVKQCLADNAGQRYPYNTEQHSVDNAEQGYCEMVAEDEKESPKKSRYEPQFEEEEHFYRLYKTILDDIMKEKEISDEAIHESLTSFKECFDYDAGRRFSDVDLRRHENMCGYLFRYGVPWSGLTRCRVLEAAKNSRELMSCLEQDKLQMVDLGCSGGNDFVGFCSALHELGFAGRRLDVTFVDKVEEWWEYIEKMLDLTSNGFGGVSKVLRRSKGEVKFIRACLTKYPSIDSDYLGALRKADVILLTWVCSILLLFDIPRVLEHIHSAMKDDALLVYVDSPPCKRDEDGKFLYNDHDFFSHFELLYLSDEYCYYSMANRHSRFGFDDGIATKAVIAIFRKERNDTKASPIPK